MFGIDLGEANTAFTIAIVYAVMVLAAFWLAMIIWTYRDMRARSRDGMAQILVVLMVAVLTLPGLLIYMFLRPRETLSEAYERSLEEEALLQEIEEKPTCPGCGQRVQANWQACPYCHTRLKKPCIACRSLIELSWNLCPYCATSQGGFVDLDDHVSRKTSEQRIAMTRRKPAAQAEAADSLQFVEGEDY